MNEIEKLLVRLIKKNKKLTNNTWSEKVDITTDTAHIEKIIIGYMPMYENKY